MFVMLKYLNEFAMCLFPIGSNHPLLELHGVQGMEFSGDVYRLHPSWRGCQVK